MSKTIMRLLWPELSHRIEVHRDSRIPFPVHLSESDDRKAWKRATQGLDLEITALLFTKKIILEIPYMVLWMDSHASHCMDGPLLRAMRQRKVVQLNYIPHTTHICQPLDTSLMSAIKKAIAKELRFLNYIKSRLHFEPKMADILMAVHLGVEAAVQPRATRKCMIDVIIESPFLTKCRF